MGSTLEDQSKPLYRFVIEFEADQELSQIDGAILTHHGTLEAICRDLRAYIQTGRIYIQYTPLLQMRNSDRVPEIKPIAAYFHDNGRIDAE